MGTDELIFNADDWVTIDASKPIKVSFGKVSTGKSFTVSAFDPDASWTMSWDTVEENEFAWR